MLIFIAEFSNVNAPDVVGQIETRSRATGTGFSNSITTTHSPSVLVGASINGGGGSTTISNGFTVLGTIFNGQQLAYYAISAGATSAAANWNQTSTANWNGFLDSFYFTGTAPNSISGSI